MLEQITPIILTYNEAPNIKRALQPLAWARDIVVVDSYSGDETLSHVAEFPQARVFQRKFDCLEKQWNYALQNTSITTEWVLALDADYIVTPELFKEIKRLRPGPGVSGFRVGFRYCIYGEPLRGSAYPPVVVLYRRERAHYRQDGHAHRVVVDGPVEQLQEAMLHDDRKSLTRWVASQDTYMQQEVEKLLEAEGRGLALPDRIRKTKLLAPFLVFLHCLLVKRGLFDGKKGLYYALQRMLAETLLAIYLLDRDLKGKQAPQEAAGEMPPVTGHTVKP